MCCQVPSAPASRLALLEQHGLLLEHTLHRSAVSFKLLAALQSLCLPEADLSAHFQKWKAGKADIRSRPLRDALSPEAGLVLKDNLQHLLRQYNSAEAACGSMTAETSLVREHIQSQMHILMSNLVWLELLCNSCP